MLLLLGLAAPADAALRKSLILGGLAQPIFAASPTGDSRLFVVERPDWHGEAINFRIPRAV